MTALTKLLPLALVLAGCAAAPTQPVKLSSTFNADQANSMLIKGQNTVRGSAMLRQSGGGVVTCAGTEVHLIPATDYAAERIRAIYRSEAGGFTTYYKARVRFEPESPSYMLLRRTTRCDPQGYFKFEGVADGDFYVLANVTWTVADYVEGGALVERVQLGAGSTKELVLTAP